MGNHHTPLEVLERLIGPPQVIGPIVGLHEKSPFVWRRGSKFREPGDIPGPKVQRKLLAYARNHGIPLTAAHLIFGAPVAEIDALVAQSKVAAE